MKRTNEYAAQHDIADLVIVGGGIAGLIAANRARELGQTCLVLEKGQDRYMCNSRLTGGLFHICFKDITAPPDLLLAAMQKEVPDSLSSGQARAIAENAARMIKWLQRQGIRFVRASPEEGFRCVLAPVRFSRLGLSWRGRGGDVLLRTLEQKLAERGGKLVRDARATELIVHDGRCVGVKAMVGGEERVFQARAVLIADGGFQGNADMTRRYISPNPSSIFPRGAATGNGDGIRMAEAIGAKLIGMSSFYGHVLSRSAFGNDDLWPYPIMDRVVAAGIAVSGDGTRFVDEGQGGVHQTNGIARLRNPLSAVAIFDDGIWQTAGRSFIFPPNPYLERRGGVLLRALDLPTLAAAAGLPADALEQTVRIYNDAVLTGSTIGLDPIRSVDRYKAMPIVKPPFFAIPLCAGLTYTMGGVAIDGRAHVLDHNDRPIPGLFAAGCVTGGLEGGVRTGYIGGLAKSASMALLAAETMAQNAGLLAA